VADNQISDISCLKDLTNLTNIHIGQNQISDISCLKEMTRLTALDIDSNKISNISLLEIEKGKQAINNYFAIEQ